MIKDGIKGIQHIGLPTEKMTETCEFYGKLGFEEVFETVNDGSKVVFFRLKDTVFEAYEVDKASGVPGALEHVALTVTDIEETYREVCDAGLNTMEDTIHFLPYWEHGVRFFTIMGPNAEKIEFSQYLQ